MHKRGFRPSSPAPVSYPDLDRFNSERRGFLGRIGAALLGLILSGRAAADDNKDNKKDRKKDPRKGKKKEDEPPRLPPGVPPQPRARVDQD